MSAALFNGIIADHARAQLHVAPKTDAYRDWTIRRGRWPEPEWSATSPDYDASWEGEEDGWVASGGHVTADTRETLIAEIDTWIEEQQP